MGIQARLVNATQSRLPNEHIQQVFLAQTGAHPYVVTLFGWLRGSMVRRFVVAVTDNAVVVFNAKHRAQATTEVRRLPRNTRIGPVSGVWSRVNIGEDKAWVHLQFHNAIRAADAAAHGV
jgi:hypothetical protein